MKPIIPIGEVCRLGAVMAILASGVVPFARGQLSTSAGTASSPALVGGDTTTNQLWGGGTFRFDQGNPLVPWFEPSVLFSADGNTAYMWALNGYSTATDPSCRVWSTPDPTKMPNNMNGWHFPYVTQDPLSGVYYLLMNSAEDGTGSIYMWSATIPAGPWTMLNSGNPVLIPSNNPTAWNYRLFNPGICFQGGTIHMLIEGLAGSGALSTNFNLGYSSSTLAAGPNFNGNMTANPVMTSSGCPWLSYVPDRNALLAVVGDTSDADRVWTLRAHVASLSSDLTNPSSWSLASGFGIETPGIHSADPTVAFTNSASKTFQCLLVWNYNQSTGYQAYAQLTLDQFYDMAANPTTYSAGQASFSSTVDAFNYQVGPLGNTVLSATGLSDKSGTFSVSTYGDTDITFNRNNTFIGGTPGSTDMLGVLAQPVGQGIILSSLNAAGTAYTPADIDASTFLFRANGSSSYGFRYDHSSFFVNGNTFLGGTPGSTDMLSVLAQPVGQGIILSSLNAAGTAYTPADIDASTFLFRANGSSSYNFGYSDASFFVNGNITVSGGIKGGYGGSFTLVAGVAVVNETRTDANSTIVFTLKSASGTISQAPYLTAMLSGQSFTVQAGSGDNSTYNYQIFEH